MPPRVNIPPLTRGCLVVCVFLSVLTGTLRYRDWMAHQEEYPPDSPTGGGGSQIYTVPYLTVVPALSIVFPWTFLTAALVEQNIFTLFITLATLFYGGKYLERAWGSREFGKFLLVVAVVPNVVTFFIYIVWFALTGNTERSFATICGGVAAQSAFLVAFKQLVPEHTVTLFKGLLKIRVKHFPAVFLLINTLSGPIFGTDVSTTLAWLGFFSSWTYLRFYKTSHADLSTNQSPTLKGDASETFAMAYFFPDPLHRPVAVISEVVYNLLISFKICTPFSAADISAGNSRAEVRGDASLGTLLGGGRGAAQPGSARAEAERRRAIALKALDQRLHAAANKPQGSQAVVNGGGGGGVLGETSLDTEQTGP
ncbi:DUF1751-domain-containing protein [Choiromyces venosus 120613-1]|uniref:DUF1751-domain-containing protein n=1 Tax=Choiromyces venosus 120613-1 TaxID=1336337 RepID=A0A3N4JIM8_9PEZI|nr:DUF1751-domain-containing protein [Choiromyces venosus 120613-1]